MASAASVNNLIEQLAQSIQHHKAATRFKTRRNLDNFIRAVRQHNFNRTNQFAVHDKIIGLQEKFHVLNRDDLADVLHDRSLELSSYGQRWIPDVLDLFLHLSNDPVNKTDIQDLAAISHRSSAPLPLNWNDFEVSDPVDQSDLVWQIPQYSDFSSDEDEVLALSSISSPSSTKHERKFDAEISRPASTLDNEIHIAQFGLAEQFEAGFAWSPTGEQLQITECQVIRELLFLCEGLPTSLFVSNNNELLLNPRYSLQTISNFALRSIVQRLVPIGKCIKNITAYLSRKHREIYLQTLQAKIEVELERFRKGLSVLQQNLLQIIAYGGTLSMLTVCVHVERLAMPILDIENFICKVDKQDPTTYLELLYSHVCEASSLYDDRSGYAIEIFCATFKSYVKPIDMWIRYGKIDANQSEFFISRVANQSDKATLWNSWYACHESGSKRCPRFFRRYMNAIFVMGKTNAFLRELTSKDLSVDRYGEDLDSTLSDVVETARTITKSTMSSFAITFETQLAETIHTELQRSTARLQAAVQKYCGLNRILDAFDALYLSQDKNVLDICESRFFKKIDKRHFFWNDRFLLTDVYKEAFSKVECVDVERLVVQIEKSENNETPWESVKIMDCVQVEYLLPWPISNIIHPQSLAVYHRIAQLLRQIRRAKYVLESIYTFVTLTTSEQNGEMPKTIRALYFRLLLFINTTSDHLLGCVIQPLTTKMRKAFVGTLDEMIHVHSSYILDLEYGCLMSKNLKALNDTLVSILDMCIEFSHQQTRGETLGSLASQFQKQVAFLIAGLQGLAASGGEVGEMMELFADRLVASRL